MRRSSAAAGILFGPANLITMFRLIALLWLLQSHHAGHWGSNGWFVAAFVTAYCVLDYLDGWVARRLSIQSSFGMELDLLSDRIADSAVACYLLLTTSQHTAAIVLFLLVRIAPDGIVNRAIYRTGKDYAQLAATFLPGSGLAGGALLRWGLDLNAWIKSFFFAFAICGLAPDWLAAVFALSTAGFLLVVAASLWISLCETRDKWDESQ